MNSKTSGVGFLSRFQLLVRFSVLTFMHDSFHDIYVCMSFFFSFFPSFMFYNLTEIKDSKSFST